MPTISVIVPVYQAQRYLERCVRSILSQSFRDLEVLLVDDGSTDGSAALCDGYAARDSRVRVFHKENGGVSSARNKGLCEARGAFLAFVDTDDWLEPDALEVLYRLLTENGCDTAGCAHYNVSPSGAAQIEAGALPEGVYRGEQLLSGIVDRLMAHRLEEPGKPVLNGFIWRFLFTREIVRREGLAFEGAYLEDELFLAEYFCHAQGLAMTGRALYHYLLNPDSATHRYMAGYMDVFRGFLGRKRALAERFGLDKRTPDWETSTLWAGLLIAVANEYAKGSPFSPAQQTAHIRSIAGAPDMAAAVDALMPSGLSRNKQVVASLLRKHRYRTVTLLYRIKNWRK